MAALSTTCPQCKKTSYHPQDVEHGYCGACSLFYGPWKDSRHLIQYMLWPWWGR